MKLTEFAFCNWNRFEYLKDFCDITYTLPEILNQLENEFDIEKVYYTNNYGECNIVSATEAFFKSSYTNKQGDNIWLRFTKNPKQYPVWYYQDFIPEKEFIRTQFRKNNVSYGDFIFQDFSSMLNFYESINNAAEEENWKRKNELDSKMNFPILASYLEHTFKRIVSEDKLIYSKDGKYIIFNTGLLDKKYLLDINVFAEIKKVDFAGTEIIVYKNPEIILEDNRKIINMFGNVNPPIANYFNNMNEVIFNPDYDLILNWVHIFEERYSRIPAEVLDTSNNDISLVILKFKGNENTIKKLARRNYKLVVPQFYNDKIQFLLPVYLGSTLQGQPDFALVLDCDHENECYYGTTILTVEMAYQNARLLAKTDSPWLKNITIG